MDDQRPLALEPPVHLPSSSPFLALTTELKQAIFSALPNISISKSLLLTCSNFYRTFRNAESLIIKSILRNQIGSDLIYDATIVWRSTMLSPFDEEASVKLLNLYGQRDLAVIRSLQTWKLQDAEDIGGLYDDIEDLSRDFASSALGTNIVTGLDETSPFPPSSSEINRIKRTFYRFELLCNILGQQCRSSDVHFRGKGLLTEFFSMCRPWENEQLRCIRDHLLDRLSLSFNDVARHDVEWGNRKIECLNNLWLCQTWHDHYLSPGLSYLHQLINTFSYEDRYRLLKPLDESPNCSFVHAFVFECHSKVLAALRRHSEEELNMMYVANSAIDDDVGPAEAWGWAFSHTGDGGVDWQTLVRQRTLRKRGYVMWDFDRLAEWSLLDYDWRNLPYEEPPAYPEQERRRQEMLKSFRARREIWNRGGRGWWSPGDESRVVWPPGGPTGKFEKEETRSC